MLIIIAVVVFAVTAFGGIVLASHIVRGEFAPLKLSLGHASVGATGLVLLGKALVDGGKNNAAMLSLALFVLTAMGGFTLASFRLRKKLPPKGSVLVHGLVAVCGFLVLVSLVLL